MFSGSLLCLVVQRRILALNKLFGVISRIKFAFDTRQRTADDIHSVVKSAKAIEKVKLIRYSPPPAEPLQYRI